MGACEAHANVRHFQGALPSSECILRVVRVDTVYGTPAGPGALDRTNRAGVRMLAYVRVGPPGAIACLPA